MSSVDPALDGVQQAMTMLIALMAQEEPNSVAFDVLSEKFSILQARKKILSTYSAEMGQRMAAVNAEIEIERAERLAPIKQEFEDKLANLPILDVINLVGEPAVDPQVVRLVTQYMQRHTVETSGIPEEELFFKSLFPTGAVPSAFYDFLKFVWSNANCPFSTKYPSSLAAMNRIIHSQNYSQLLIVVLDTSLRPIMTNSNFTKAQFLKSLVIYDSKTGKVVSISVTNETGRELCNKCLRFMPFWHCCESQCLICLRTGSRGKCCKPAAQSEPKTCPVCKAICQTDDCFRAHKYVCPWQVHGLRDDVFHRLETVIAKA